MDDSVEIECRHCGREIDPYEETVWVWKFVPGKHPFDPLQIFVCSGCDSEFRTNYSTTLAVDDAIKEIQLKLGLGDRN